MFGAVPKWNLFDLVYQGKNIKDIITWGPMEIGFISGGSGITGMSNLSRESLTYIIRNLAELDTLTDIIIIDTGAGISDSVLEFLVACGEVLLVTTPEPTSITDSYSLLKALRSHPRFSTENTRIKMVANKVANEREGQLLYDKLHAVVEKYLKLPFFYLGAVEKDKNLEKAVMQQVPVSMQNPEARSSRQYEAIAGKLMNVPETAGKQRGMVDFFSHIINSMRMG